MKKLVSREYVLERKFSTTFETNLPSFSCLMILQGLTNIMNSIADVFLESITLFWISFRLSQARQSGSKLFQAEKFDDMMGWGDVNLRCKLSCSGYWNHVEIV